MKRNITFVGPGCLAVALGVMPDLSRKIDARVNKLYFDDKVTTEQLITHFNEEWDLNDSEWTAFIYSLGYLHGSLGLTDSNLTEALSLDDKREAISNALRAKFSGAYCWARDVYDSYVVFEVTDAAGQTRLLKCDYSFDAQDEVTLGDATEVREEKSYVPVENAPALVLPSSVNEGAQSIDGEYTQLCEAAKADLAKGAALVKVIAPGWNIVGNRYYPADVLQRDLTEAFPIGTKMFANHRPRVNGKKTEGRIEDLAAVFRSPCMYMEQGPDGPGGYAYVDLKENWKAPLATLAADIGTSIDNGGLCVNGEADGRKGAIVKRIYNDGLPSVDFVTTAGAGGKIISLQEAAEANPIPPAQETIVDDNEAQALRDENAALKTQVSQLQTTTSTLQEAATTTAAKAFVESKIPAHVTGDKRTALVESLSAQAPKTDAGALDEAAFTPLVEAVTSAMAPPAGVRGLGPTVPINDGGQPPQPIPSMRSAMGI